MTMASSSFQFYKEFWETFHLEVLWLWYINIKFPNKFKSEKYYWHCFSIQICDSNISQIVFHSRFWAIISQKHYHLLKWNVNRLVYGTGLIYNYYYDTGLTQTVGSNYQTFNFSCNTKYIYLSFSYFWWYKITNWEFLIISGVKSSNPYSDVI